MKKILILLVANSFTSFIFTSEDSLLRKPIALGRIHSASACGEVEKPQESFRPHLSVGDAEMQIIDGIPFTPVVSSNGTPGFASPLLYHRSSINLSRRSKSCRTATSSPLPLVETAATGSERLGAVSAPMRLHGSIITQQDAFMLRRVVTPEVSMQQQLSVIQSQSETTIFQLTPNAFVDAQGRVATPVVSASPPALVHQLTTEDGRDDVPMDGTLPATPPVLRRQSATISFEPLSTPFVPTQTGSVKRMHSEGGQKLCSAAKRHCAALDWSEHKMLGFIAPIYICFIKQ